MAENRSPGTVGPREEEVRSHVKPEKDSLGNKQSMEDNVKKEKSLNDSEKYPD